MKTSDKLLARLRERWPDLIPEDATVVRNRRGRHGISAGTWAWFIHSEKKLGVSIGSEDTMADCVKAKSLEGYDDRAGSWCVCAEDS